MHRPIQFQDLSLSFPHKTCFSDFSGQILYGSRIAIIGRNGEGKSTLLKILAGTFSSYEGRLSLPKDLCPGFLPQLIESFETLSGGERLNHVLTEVFCKNPNLLLLDEPSNHLDKSNRRALINHLRHYTGTLVLVTHDMELLKNLADTIWHIQHGAIHVFNGDYEDYQNMINKKISSIEHEVALLKRQKKEAHQARMQEQERTKKMCLRGEMSITNRKWPTIRSHTKMGNAIKTGDKRLNQIRETQQRLADELSLYQQAEVIQPHFQLGSSIYQKIAITIQDAAIHYEAGPIILQNLNFHMRPNERVALHGDNGSGKSTFVKAILDAPVVKKTGHWVTPKAQHIGYLDQHYQTLKMKQTVLETVSSCMPQASILEVRKHLNDFLFRKNQEVEATICDLSGGEKARLSLCCIAAFPPALLILDEVTNNLDLETRAHVIQILQAYPGAMLVISHDEDFLNAIHIETHYLIAERSLNGIKGDSDV